MTNGNINFGIGPTSDKNFVGSYTGTITSSITNYYNGTTLSKSATFKFTVVDACLSTTIQNSTSYTDQAVYVWDPTKVYSTSTSPALPTYSDTVSTS